MEKILILSGDNPGKAAKVYELYLQETSYKSNDLLTALSLSAFSGVCLGNYESKSFGYTHIDWMPVSFQYWYNQENNSDKVFGKFLTWAKVFREMDYISDNYAYMTWLTYFGNKWYFAIVAHWVVKNLAATIIRDQNKYSEPFHSFNFNLIF